LGLAWFPDSLKLGPSMFNILNIIINKFEKKSLLLPKKTINLI
jgi:hypothetical protein